MAGTSFVAALSGVAPSNPSDPFKSGTTTADGRVAASAPILVPAAAEKDARIVPVTMPGTARTAADTVDARSVSSASIAALVAFDWVMGDWSGSARVPAAQAAPDFASGAGMAVAVQVLARAGPGAGAEADADAEAEDMRVALTEGTSVELTEVHTGVDVALEAKCARAEDTFGSEGMVVAAVEPSPPGGTTTAVPEMLTTPTPLL